MFLNYQYLSVFICLRPAFTSLHPTLMSAKRECRVCVRECRVWLTAFFRMNGTEITTVDLLQKFLTDWPIGRQVKVPVLRVQERLELDVTPSEAGAHE